MAGFAPKGFSTKGKFILFLVIALMALESKSSPALLTGVVTSFPGGQPVIGARIAVNGQFTYSVMGGVYSLTIAQAGTYPVACSKAGYESLTSQPVIFQPGVTTSQNFTLYEYTFAPAALTAVVDTQALSVTLSWPLPVAPYEMIQDDGIQENFTIWSGQGNMNAVKFTPATFPVKITGGSVHIGSTVNYPPGGNPLTPFKIQVFDATGPQGVPGNPLSPPLTVVPTAYGWVSFSLNDTVNITSGSFYLVMIQQGSPPNAAGLAVDETTPQFRSYSRFVTGGSPWFPAGGNFMIRALVTGSGGPLLLTDQSTAATSCQLFRLRQGEEQNPAAWILLGTFLQPGTTDTAWQYLPCGPYRWGVKAAYAGNRWSPVTFSNVIGKCWTVPVSCQIQLSCTDGNRQGTSVKLSNLALSDTVRSALTDTNGMVVFSSVWKGTYQMLVTRFGYDTIRQTIQLTNAVSMNQLMLQAKVPPENLTVNDTSLFARWDVPNFEYQLFSENWNTGSFAANNWEVSPSASNWQISSASGSPAPAAIFAPVPALTGFGQTLTSRNIQGVRSTLLKLRYDILFDQYSTTSVNQLAVEIWNGSQWNLLKNFSSSTGNIPWTSEESDISAFSDQMFRIRFRAAGENSMDIQNWSIDNIAIIASEPAQEQAKCILGYYFYLGNTIVGYTEKNAYQIPPEQVQYGQSYMACVRALYGSGYSDPVCKTFTSKYLCPVRNLHGYPVENTAFVTWEKPALLIDSVLVPPAGLIGYIIYRDHIQVGLIHDPDSLIFYDYDLEPGLYRYEVTARYDLTDYGFPGQISESLRAGPLHITITWGRTLPFLETWEQGNFSFNEWRFVPRQGNWQIDQTSGNPAPAAVFQWDPVQTNYNFSLESPAFNGLDYTCAAIWLDFDLTLSDNHANEKEKLLVELFYNGTWHPRQEVKNSGSFIAKKFHLDISIIRGKGFRVRFRANGVNSSDIRYWQIDNIHIYPVCYAAEGLAASQSGNVVHLTWNPPACHGGNSIKEGFESSGFPPVNWSEISTNPTTNWSRFTLSSVTGVHSGNGSAGLDWDYNHQDEWLIAENAYVSGSLSFWSYAYQGSLHQDHYYVKISTNDGGSWNPLLDLSSLPPFPSVNGINDWETPYIIDLSDYIGQTVDLAWHAIDGDGNGLWYPWAIDDCIIGDGDALSLTPGENRGGLKSNRSFSGIYGYDVFRKGEKEMQFVKLNPNPVNDTNYLDSLSQSGKYQYFIHALFSECTNTENSDTIDVNVITGINVLNHLSVHVFPNPAAELITVAANEGIAEMEITTIDGRRYGWWICGAVNTYGFSVSQVPPGLYFLIIRFCDRQTAVQKLVIRRE